MKDITFPTEENGVKYGNLELNPGSTFIMNSSIYTIIKITLIETGDIMVYYKKFLNNCISYNHLKVEEFSELLTLKK